MTLTRPATMDRPSKRRLYRRLLVGFVVAGTLAGLALRAIGYPLVGEGVYWLGIVGFLAVWLGTSVTLFDERDVAIERRASHITLLIVAVVAVLGASTARVLPRVSDYTVPPLVGGALYGYVGLFGVFAVVYLWLRYRT